MSGPEIPPEYAACLATGHDPDDEGPAQNEARHALKCERQAWKARTFMHRYAMTAHRPRTGVSFAQQAEQVFELAQPWLESIRVQDTIRLAKSREHAFNAGPCVTFEQKYPIAAPYLKVLRDPHATQLEQYDAENKLAELGFRSQDVDRETQLRDRLRVAVTRARIVMFEEHGQMMATARAMDIIHNAVMEQLLRIDPDDRPKVKVTMTSPDNRGRRGAHIQAFGITVDW